MARKNPIAALYIDPRGPYPQLADVECWDEACDARLYAGPWPVIAHPPCGAWSSLRRLSHGAGRDCAPLAVEQVRAFGGVLEQPARSTLWGHCALPLPGAAPDAHGGFSIEVEQCAWGHVARKRTWLYFVGVDQALVKRGVLTGGTPTHWVSGGRKQRMGGGACPPGIKICGAEQRRRTPPMFASWLAALTRTSNPASRRGDSTRGE